MARPAQQIIFIRALNNRELKIRTKRRNLHPGKSLTRLRRQILPGILPLLIQLLLRLILQLPRFHIRPKRFIKRKKQQHNTGC